MPHKPLINYLPDYWSEVVDIHALFNGVTPPLEDLIKAHKQALDDQFILTMSLERLEAWEDMFQLSPGPLDIDSRKKRLISTISRSTPFSLPFLENYLNQLLGLGKWYHILLYEDTTYKLLIDFRQRQYINHVKEMIDAIMPAHIVLEYDYYLPTYGRLLYGIQPVYLETYTYAIHIPENLIKE